MSIVGGPNTLTTSDILVLKIFLVLVLVQFGAINFSFSSVLVLKIFLVRLLV